MTTISTADLPKNHVRPAHFFDPICQTLRQLSPDSENYAAAFVDALLAACRELGASDVHLRPNEAGLDISLRIDGVLQPLGTFPAGRATHVVSRLKVLADLLTYRTDVPQEGRIRVADSAVEMRVSTFPTLYGEKAVVRLFAAQSRLEFLADLGLPAAIETRLAELLGETSGAILITGPAGSGKTTTLYAALRQLARRTAGGRSIATLEDPIEVALPGIAQTQVNQPPEFNLAAGLRSLLRQDPEVIAVGEMRDAQTAGIALQASLTGQLVLTTFHAASAAGAIGRLSDMGVEPYMLRSGILAVICQRLLRRLCSCATESDDPAARLGLPLETVRQPAGCERCHGTGYQGRLLLAEMLTLELANVAGGVLERWDAGRLEQAAIAGGMQTRWDSALASLAAGQTSPQEVRRVLGFSDAFSGRSG